MEEMNQILYKDYKTFPDSTQAYFSNEFFAIRLNVGNQGFTYAFTPYLAKRFSERLIFLVKLYEDTERKIPIATSTLSPIQQEDLNKPDEPGKRGGRFRQETKKAEEEIVDTNRG